MCLQSIPASQIKSIEVITNPGAKYDAEGLGGIINIILKSNTARGINGSMSLTVGTRAENGSFNFNARQGNFGVNAFISGNLRLLPIRQALPNACPPIRQVKRMWHFTRMGVTVLKDMACSLGLDLTGPSKRKIISRGH